ncbi:MAG: response regulator [Bacteroidota bacterium]
MNKKTQILLVEDNPADVQLMRLTLSALTDQVQMTHYANGWELMQQLPTLEASSIQLILLDLNMPRMGGIETLQQLHQYADWCKVPIIIFTSSAAQQDIDRCYQLGANDYINKPMDYDKFSETVQHILESWTGVTTSTGA